MHWKPPCGSRKELCPRNGYQLLEVVLCQQSLCSSLCWTELYVLSYSGSVFSCSLPTYPTSVLISNTNQLRSVAEVDLCSSGGLHPHHPVLGRNALSPPVDTIHPYNLSMNSWHIIGHVPTARYNCLVATLPGDTLVVIGGFTTKGLGCCGSRISYVIHAILDYYHHAIDIHVIIVHFV